MILLESDLSRVRIHMGIPVLGVQDSGFALGFRYANVMGLFEWRVKNLQPWEYTHVTGYPAAAVSVMGSPQVGNTLSATVASLAQYTYTVQASDLTAQDPVLSALTNFCNGFNSLNAASFVASPQPAITFSPTAVSPGPKTWQLAFVSTAMSAFTVAVTSTGLTAFVTAQGVVPTPTLTFQDDNTTCTGYLAICDYLQAKTATSSDLAKYSKADVVQFRQNELGYREAIYKNWRQKLADYLGIPLYPMQPVGRFGGANTGLVI